VGRYLDAIRGAGNGEGGWVGLLKESRYIFRLCEFRAGLKKDGAKGGYIFKFAVQTRSKGVWQLRGALEMLLKAQGGGPPDKKVQVIVGKCETINYQSERKIQAK